MNLCSEKHEEVCYESRDCPVCDLRDELMSQIEDLENQVSRLESE